MIKLTFSSNPKDQDLTIAANEYQSIWDKDGQKIISIMEATSGLIFSPQEISVIVYEGISQSGTGNLPMKLRASYPLEVKKGTLVHELGHRLIGQLTKRPSDLDEHQILFLILYDIWIALYGKDFADNMIETEKLRKGYYDYAQAWKQALTLTKEDRMARFESIKKLNES